MNDQNGAIPMGAFGPPPGSNAHAHALSLLARNVSNSASIPSAANLPQNLFTVPAVQPSSVINLTNSNEVVIGPMTQYQGPVTIYQYMDATVEARAMHANGGIRQNATTRNTTTLLQKLSTNSLVLILLVIIIVVSVGIATYLALQKQNTANDNKPQPILFGNNYETGTFPNLGNGHLVIDRDQWGASDQYKVSYKLNHPIPYVLITHADVPPTVCYNVYKCSIKMRTFQDTAVAEEKLPDINSNFYVGHDGNVYVGRGWNIVNTYANQSLAVTFIGNYMRYEPGQKQLEAVEYLLAYGLTNKYLALDYKLVAQNQTQETQSPGVNVYKEIIKWPHWYPCGMKDNPKCGTEINLPDIWDAHQ